MEENEKGKARAAVFFSLSQGGRDNCDYTPQCNLNAFNFHILLLYPPRAMVRHLIL